MIDLCTLGTGGTIPMPERALSSLYLRLNGQALLIDCGEGTQIQIEKLGWGFLCIQGLLLTHYHADHCSGLPGFLLALAKATRTEPFHIWGPPGLRTVVNGLRVIAPQLPYPLVLHELPDEDSSFSLLGLDICAFPLRHGLPCLGYRFELKRPPAFLPQQAAALGLPLPLWGRLQRGETVTHQGRTVEPQQVMGPTRPGIVFVYATDTRPVPGIVTHGQGADLMILEGMYGEEQHLPLALKNHHMLFAESAQLAAQAGAKRLLLTHFSTRIEQPEELLPAARAVFPQTDVAADGMKLTLSYPERR